MDPVGKKGAQGYIVIHGHFYQPPRENPWIEEIEAEPSAQPFHDWNARITAECYGPNACARVYDGQRRILDVVNNYEYLSFNFGAEHLLERPLRMAVFPLEQIDVGQAP